MYLYHKSWINPYFENEINNLVDKNKINNQINEFFYQNGIKKEDLPIISSISIDAAAVKLFHSMILTPDIKENNKNIQEIFNNFEVLYEECIKNNEVIPIEEEHDLKSFTNFFAIMLNPYKNNIKLRFYMYVLQKMGILLMKS